MVAWIGRGGTIAWPPRSPDSTLLEFSVWVNVKDQGFSPYFFLQVWKYRVFQKELYNFESL
jgi:hypothetical protein